MLKRLFENEGYEVHCVHDGVKVLEAIEVRHPDLILLDVKMPNMDGFEVLRRLRKAPVTAKIPTIMITASGEWPDIVQGLTLGADDYVRKPFHPKELLARAESKMRARQLEETLERRTQDLEALLRASEALNQNLDFAQLLELVVYLTIDLLPGEVALIYQLSPDQKIVRYHAVTKSDRIRLADIDHQAVLASAFANGLEYLDRVGRPLLGDALPFGMLTPLQYASDQSVRGLVLVAGRTEYDLFHKQLFDGIGQQSNLALRNAEMFNLQANYAIELERQVEERTRELKSAQRMLIRAEKLSSIGHLSSSLAHEINNPLMPIRMTLDDLRECVEEGYEIELRSIDVALESVERIQRIVRRLLEFTGRGASDKPPIKELLDINQVIENVEALVRKMYQHQRKEIILNLGDVPQIYGDRDSLEQVFMNLALNAAHATRENGWLRITTSAEDTGVVITISDNGCGIEPEWIDKIFDPFVTTKEDGNGLGLFVTYGIIEDHSGQIDVESTVGQGTTFTIRLPLPATVA